MVTPVVGEVGVGVRFGVLGPLRVVDGAGDMRAVSAAKQRVVLAALLLGGGRVVSAGGLAQALWDASPPPNASSVMRTYVMRLRRALGPAGVRITGGPPGWAVDLRAAEELDLSEVDDLCRAARAEREAGQWSQVSLLLGRALELWRGEPLVDVPSAALARQEVPRLAELWLQIAEARIDADLRLGRHGEVVAELRRLVAGHPLREHFRVQLMLACYRCGDQAAALAAYLDARQALAGELGIEPGRELRDMHQKILAADPDLALGPVVRDRVTAGEAMAGPGLAGGAAGKATTQPGLPGEPAVTAGLADGGGAVGLSPVSAVVPRQLPAPVRHFAGRAGELECLSELAGEAASAASPAVVISAIGGMAGVGKTALALHFAHQIAGRFGDGQLYVNLRGFDPDGQPVQAAEALGGFLAALGAHPGQVPADLEGRAGLYRSLLAGRRVLIVLDNAREAAQVRPLLPGSGGCLVIVTSRNQLAGLAAADGAQLLPLDVLGEQDAAGLLAAGAGPERVAAEPAAAAEIAALCGRLPLALAVAAARAAARPRHPLAALGAELRAAGSRLDALDAGEATASTRAVLSWSYQHLTGPAARMFRLLGLHPGPDITAAAAASLAGLQPAQADSALRELTAASVLTEHAPGRYVLHDLLRCYAAELGGTADSDHDRRAATDRMTDHYLHTGNRFFAGSWCELELAAPQDGVTPEVIAGEDDLAWFEAEHDIMLRLAGQAAATAADARAWQLPWIMTHYLDQRGYWHEWATAQRAALAAATRLDDQAGQARARHSLGQACIRLRDYAAGLQHLDRALELYEKLGDRDHQAHVHICRCVVSDMQHDHASAMAGARQALDLLGPDGPADLRAIALNNLGFAHALNGDYQQALTWCEQARDLGHEPAPRYSGGGTWDSMGYAYTHLGHHDQAIDCYQRAQQLQSGNRYEQAKTTVYLGDAHAAAGHPAAAREAWQQALAIFDDLHHADAAQVRARLHHPASPD
jgi:DNA-binding SARP family transcriptional activator/tetratricopeptide (TPR) repeat protein